MNTTSNLPIAVGVDGSESATHATRWAGEEAARGHCALTLIHVSQPPADLALGKQLLRDAAATVESAAPGVQFDTDLAEGSVAATLVERSSRTRLLVVGSHANAGFPELLAGSVAITLATHGHCPIAVIRGLPVDEQAPVVVGIDGSPVSEAALAFAMDAASRRGVPLVAYHAWNPNAPVSAGGGPPFVLDWNIVRADEQEVLAERLAGWQQQYPDVTVRRVVEKNHPARGLLEQSAHARLMVVGSRGHSGLRGLLPGSTSHALIHNAACPVVVVRPAP